MLKQLENEIKKLCPEIEKGYRISEIHSKSNNGKEWAKVILGRDITLPDILKVLATCDMEFVVDCDGQFLYRTEYEEEGKVECYSRTDVHWNPDEPLHLQSKEVKEFLSKLILKK